MELVLPSDLTPFLTYFTSYPHKYNWNTPAYIEEVLKTSKALEIKWVKTELILENEVRGPGCRVNESDGESLDFTRIGCHVENNTRSKSKTLRKIYFLQVHQLYKNHWNRWKVKSTDNPNFAERQLASLLSYNAEQRMRLVVQKKKRKTRRSEPEE